MNKSEKSAEEFRGISEEIESNVEESAKEKPKQGRPKQAQPPLGRFRTDKVDAKTRRKPIGTKDILKFPERKGYVRRVVNDFEDRIKKFENAGWRVVQEIKEGGDTRVGAVSQLASPKEISVGGGMKAFLMEIPEELFKEDQLAKQKTVDLSEESIMRTGATAGSNKPIGAQYGEVKIVKKSNF